MRFDPDHWLEIGKIVAPQGLRGELRVYPSTDFPQRFLDPGERWLLKNGSSTIEAIQLTNGRHLEGKGLYVITIEGVTNRDQAEQLRNARLWVPESDRPPLEEGEFHVADLIGLSVYHHTTGDYIGEVINILPAGHDILEVRRPSIMPSPQEQEPNLHPKQNEPNASEPQRDNPSNSRKSSRKSKSKSKSKPKKPPTILIPFVYDIAPVVDLKRQRIEVLPPPGLIEL